MSHYVIYHVKDSDYTSKLGEYVSKFVPLTKSVSYKSLYIFFSL